MFSNILHTVELSVKRLKNRPCMRFKGESGWDSISWEEMWREVRAIAKGLIAIGVKKGDRVVILSSTRPAWTLCDLATLSCGGISVPIYPNLAKQHVAAIISDATPAFAFLEHEGFHALLRSIGAGGVRTILFDGEDELSLSELKRFGASISDDILQRRLEEISLEDEASYIYTSGTTGEPKGAIITHGNIAAEIDAVRCFFHFSPRKLGLLCLPLAHVFARMVQFYQLVQGCQTGYAESLEKLAEGYVGLRPHFVSGVPRMLEKIHERVLASLRTAPFWKQRLFWWGIRLGMKRGELMERRQRVPVLLQLRTAIARTLVMRPLLRRLGGRLSTFICGGAPLNKETAIFFRALGVLVLEGYGLTETFAAVTVNRFHDYHFGTAGKPVPGVEIRLAADGEILIKGPMVFKGYLHQPEETKAIFDKEGWLKTGDIGEFMSDGFLRITDRKKEIIVTSGGKNIPPQMIERKLEESLYIENAFVYGDRRKYLTALITLNPSTIAEFARKEGVRSHSHIELADHPKVRKLLNREVAKVNEGLSNFETIKRFSILFHPFSVEGGELTPTLKLKRREIERRYEEILNSLYEGA